MKIKPFKGIRPPKLYVEEVESRPYDVLSSEEARAEAGDNEKSLYHIIKPEINFPEGTSEYDPRVYEEAARQFRKFQDKGWLVQDEKEQYYIYAQTSCLPANDFKEKTQYGIVIGAYSGDYTSGAIKKHELTRADKEEDRMKHVRVNDANIEPVFFAYPDNEVLLQLIGKYAKLEPEYDFIAPIDGFGHKLWVVSDDNDIKTITPEGTNGLMLFIRAIPYNYYALLTILMMILMVVFKIEFGPMARHEINAKNGDIFTVKAPVAAGEEDVEKKGKEEYRPQHAHQFSLYLDGEWYSLDAKPGTFDDSDPIGVLDVDISSRLILQDILELGDLRSSQRIDFVGGLRGLGELKRRVDSGEMRAALALYPVSMQQIMDIADSGNIMPPKATWFEPKLRSGLIIHSLD